MSGQRLKVLIIAHEFSPFSGSECAVGWNIVTRLAAYHDVTALYASGSQADPTSYKNSVNKYFSQNPPIPGLTLQSISQPGSTLLISKFNSLFDKIGPVGLPFLYYLGYKMWQKAAFKQAVILHRRIAFDIAHQLTQISFREPGYIWKLGVPFFWGPTGGLANMPAEYYATLPLRSKLMEGIRFLSNIYQSFAVRRIIKANKEATVIYTYSDDDALYFKRRANGQVKLMLDVGTSINSEEMTDVIVMPDILTAVWCGQLTYRKAPDILLKAVAKGSVTRERVRVKIIGTGPLEDKMHDLATKLNLKNIEWIKNVPHAQVFRIMKDSDFLIHTSLREATSSVIPEALSNGLPVICHDVNGMSIAVNEKCGIKVPLRSPDNSIAGFYEAMTKLILEKEALKELKLGARVRSSEITWDNMARTIAADYLNAENKKLKN
jgi:glycosyltransferase involved in cell wall biosynthesis